METLGTLDPEIVHGYPLGWAGFPGIGTVYILTEQELNLREQVAYNSVNLAAWMHEV